MMNAPFFAAAIILTSENIRFNKDTCAKTVIWIDLWDQSRFAALVNNTITYRQGGEKEPSWVSQWRIKRSVQHRPTTAPCCLVDSDRQCGSQQYGWEGGF